MASLRLVRPCQAVRVVKGNNGISEACETMPGSQASKGTNSNSAIALGQAPLRCACENAPRVLSGQLLLAADERHGKGACFGGARGLVLQVVSDPLKVTQAVTFLQEMQSWILCWAAATGWQSADERCDWDRYLCA